MGCASNEFECDDGTCIDEDDECDGVFHCPDASDEALINGDCAVPPPTWLCLDQYFNDGFCDCGCGERDIDCPNADLNDCEFCNNGADGGCTSAADSSQCPSNIDPNDITQCL